MSRKFIDLKDSFISRNLQKPDSLTFKKSFDKKFFYTESILPDLKNSFDTDCTELEKKHNNYKKESRFKYTPCLF